MWHSHNCAMGSTDQMMGQTDHATEGCYLCGRCLRSVQRQAEDGHSSISLALHQGQQGCLASPGVHLGSVCASCGLQQGQQQRSVSHLKGRVTARLQTHICSGKPLSSDSLRHHGSHRLP